MTSPKFSLDQQDGQWKVKLTDCQTDEIYSLDDVDEVFITFYKPNGVTFTVSAVLIEDLPDNPGEFNIVYTNSAPDDSILDYIGFWQYTGSFTLIDSANIATSQRANFRVG